MLCRNVAKPAVVLRLRLVYILKNENEKREDES